MSFCGWGGEKYKDHFDDGELLRIGWGILY